MRTFSRREAVTRAAVVLIGAAALARGARANTSSVTEVAPGVFVRTGVHELATAANKDAIANIGFIIGRDSVAVIDPGGSLTDGLALKKEIRARTALPIRYVIITHIHPDHILGAPAFTDERPEVIGHAALPKAIAERGEFYRRGMLDLLGDQGGATVEPTRLIAGEETIDLGGRPLTIHAHGVGHSGNDLSIFDQTTLTLWAADLVFVTRVPSLDGSIRGWLRELDYLSTIKAARVVPGHGPASLPWPEAAADARRYLETLMADVRSVLKKGGDIDEAAQVAGVSERDRWQLFDDYNAHNAALAFHELEWENVK